MKLCWLLPTDHSGGISPVAFSCCQQATANGHEATMLLLAPPTIIIGDDVRVSSLKLYASAPETPRKLLQWLYDNPQDIVFFNACSEFDPVIPYLLPTIKCVYVVHDTAPPYWHSALEDEDNIEAIVAVSETVASKFRHRLKQPQKLYVIHNGCLFPEILDKDSTRKDELIFLGGDNPTKGAFDVLKLWKQLFLQGFRGKLHWFGNVTSEFRNKIEQLPNSEHIQVHGYVQRDKLFSTAASAKVLLMLSRVEPFGMATIEAMSMGCVPVAWDVDTGTKEIITANQTGLFAPLGNMQVLARQVLYACENYHTFSNAVIERARSDFDESVMWKSYEYLINEISSLEPITRSKQGQKPPKFQPPVRRFQLLHPRLRSAIREFIGRSPSLGYWLRDMRGL
ncbi:MAG: glycosyltransferase family 4 protein [Fischerella sp.]|jgi:glycosyltransferase involved in cell wall biosynthesis|uniref:glycosyltransferase family 4 protein n=1 Tax=Fischerella sp. TaxID=1191 RepID=UPI0017A11E1D|nr:glycosyltransferase family 4 protein [Fischerella sp.]NWF61055.1 glycosyltransferase family 4 protein [Fischerella sp.]